MFDAIDSDILWLKMLMIFPVIYLIRWLITSRKFRIDGEKKNTYKEPWDFYD